MNIVIIDDDIFVSGALKTILETSGDITVSATGTDGKDAVRLFRTYRPDVLLMDIRMKELSGLDASAEILKEFPDAKILLLTTFSDDELSLIHISEPTRRNNLSRMPSSA